MKKLSAFIVKYNIPIALLFVGLMVFSIFSMSWVYVENDITLYLSDESNAKAGMLLMNSEFLTYAAADVMVEDVRPEQAEALAEQIRAMDGVLMLTYDDTEAHYRDNSALYSITFTGPADRQEVVDSYNGLKSFLSGYTAYFVSDSFSSMSDSMNTEMLNVLKIVCCVVAVVFLFTTTSYFEIVVLLITFVVAAVLNMGTHYFFGTISFVSNSVSIILQLALSVDYAIILSNHYKEEHQTKSVREAVGSALVVSIPEIAASSLTTIAGLAAMTFMDFKLGMDMGLVLIKAIVISIVTVFLFMPSMLVLFGRLMDKTTHRSFIPKVSFLGKVSYGLRFILPPLFVVLVFLSYLGFGKINYSYSQEILSGHVRNELQVAQEHVWARFGQNKMLPVIVPAGDYEKEAALIHDIEACDEVNSVLGLANIDAIKGYKLADSVTYKDVMKVADIDETTAKALIAYNAAGENARELLDADLETYSVPLIDLFLSLHDVAESGSFEISQEQLDMINDLYGQLVMAQDQLQGEQYSRIIVYISLPEQSQETYDFIDKVYALAQSYYPDDTVYLTGMPVAVREFSRSFGNDSRIVGTLSLVFVLIILFLTFRSVAMPLLLILVIQGSIWINFARSMLTGEYVFFMWYLIVAAVQMGANIDYAIVVSSRYQELRSKDVSPRDAIIDTLNFSFPTVITSGLLMVASGLLIGYKVSDISVFGIGEYIGTGTLVSLMLVNFVLPSLLVLGDSITRATTLHLPKLITVKDPKRTAQSVIAGLLAAVSLFLLIKAPSTVADSKITLEKTTKETTALIKKTDELRQLSEAVAEKEKLESETKAGYAEHLLTDKIGAEQLEAGRQEYQEGADEIEYYRKQLEDGEEQYRVGYEQYLAGVKEYEEGEAKLLAGQQEYDNGQVAYSEGEVRLEQGQLEYDQGVIQLEEAKQQYEQAKLLLTAIEPAYNFAMSAYEEYQTALAQYEEAVNSGDPLMQIRALMLKGNLDDKELLFRTSLNGKSLEGLLFEYQDAQDQLAYAENEIAAGEDRLANGKAELEAGKLELAAAEVKLENARKQIEQGWIELQNGQRQLEDGKAQLDAARAELDAGKAELEKGEEQLAAGKEELDAGIAQLDENREKLNADLASLDEIKDDREKLNAGLKSLLSIEGIARIAGNNTEESQIFVISNQYLSDQLRTYSQEIRLCNVVLWLLAAASAGALICLMMWLLAKKDKAAGFFASITFILSLTGALTWWMGCRSHGMLIFYTAALLSVLSAIAAELIRSSIQEEFEVADPSLPEGVVKQME